MAIVMIHRKEVYFKTLTSMFRYVSYLNLDIDVLKYAFSPMDRHYLNLGNINNGLKEIPSSYVVVINLVILCSVAFQRKKIVDVEV